MIASDNAPYDRNLKLLVGYHLLGVGETDAAMAYLEDASSAPQNAQGASVLLDLARQVREAEAQAEVAEIEP